MRGTRPPRRRLALVGLTIGLASLVACTAPPLPGQPLPGQPPGESPPSPTVTPGGPASPGTTPSAATPSPSGSPSASPGPRGEIALDLQSTLRVNPVDYGGRAVVVASFSSPRKGRAVVLQRPAGDRWSDVGSGRQNARGRVEFRVPPSADGYRAVALADGKLKPVATRRARAADQWRTAFAEEFNGSRLDRAWSTRFEGEYIPSRICSAPSSDMVTVRDGTLRASVAAVSGARARAVRANAARKLGISSSKACPDGVYDNAMISTQRRFAFAHGTIAARVKVPAPDGQHASVWLQGDSPEVEIDFYETFGHGRGIQHKLHQHTSSGSRALGGYVTSIPAVKNRSWWERFHVVSVEWTPREYVFRIDGVETYRTSKALSRQQKFLIISLMTSDWELPRMNPRDLPSTLVVDWIRVWQERR